MAVVVKYVVERDGEERMTFSTKAEADAYDKMLDLAEALQPLLAESGLVSEEQEEDLALFLAGRKEQLLTALKGKKPARSAAKETKASKAA
ncbi:YebG family protein [Ferrimonas balearica]|uniref:YebG family protein n=1 Tax=Ferrimonas balearica TaxID=44012 RepID=UPI001C99A592|nr:YebG family protein [Ferrimonas balearica]MBY5991822.1 YebG family protein [Ferrimonas balearica]